MIKTCKITNIINPPIRGVVNKPIKEGAIVDLNCGQILACLGISNVDEILPSGSLVRLNRDNYKKDNSGSVENITIQDSVAKLNTVIEGTKIPDPEPTDLNNIQPEPIAPAENEVKEEVKIEENPVVEENISEKTEINPTTTETQKPKNNKNKNNNRK